MADYAGVTTLIFSTDIGNKKMSLLQVAVTNYNATGIPLTPRVAAMGVIEAVIPFIHGMMDNASSPFGVAYDRPNNRCLCYSAPGTPVPNDINISSITGSIMLLVIGA